MVGWTHSVLVGLYGHYGHYGQYGLYGRYGLVGPIGPHGVYGAYGRRRGAQLTNFLFVTPCILVPVGLACLFHAFSAGACWRARRVAGLRTARCAASCADLCAVSCAARSAEPCEAVCSLLKRGRKKRKKKKKKNSPKLWDDKWKMNNEQLKVLNYNSILTDYFR